MRDLSAWDVGADLHGDRRAVKLRSGTHADVEALRAVQAPGAHPRLASGQREAQQRGESVHDAGAGLGAGAATAD